MEPANSTASTTNCWKQRMLVSPLGLIEIVGITSPCFAWRAKGWRGNLNKLGENPLAGGTSDLTVSFDRSEGCICRHFSSLSLPGDDLPLTPRGRLPPTPAAVCKR